MVLEVLRKVSVIRQQKLPVNKQTMLTKALIKNGRRQKNS